LKSNIDLLSDFFFRDAFRAQGCNQLPQALGQVSATGWIDGGHGPRQDAYATPPLQLQPPFVGQYPVRFGYRIKVDVQRTGQFTNRRQVIVGFDLAADQASSQSIHNLPVYGDIGSDIYRK